MFARLRNLPLTEMAVVAAFLLLLEQVRLHDYLLFHGLAEMVAVVVAGAIFALVLAVRRGLDNGLLYCLGLAYGGVALIDLLHVLTYPGMQADGGSADRAAQFWVAARLLEAGALAIAPLFAGRRLRTVWVLTPVILVTVGLIAAIHPLEVFPSCLHPKTGLTLFKIGAEVVVWMLLVLSAAGFVLNRDRISRRVFRAGLAALAFTLAGEVFFTLYAGPYDLVNAIGHYCKFISYICIYSAVILTIVRRPERVLHGSLRRQRDLLRSAIGHYASILDSMVDPVCIIGAERRVIYHNAAMDRIFGHPPEDACCHHYLLGRSIPCRGCNLEGVLAGEGKRHEVHIAGRDYDVVETPLRDGGQAAAKLSIYRDVTDQKRVRVQLLEHERELSEALGVLSRRSLALQEANTELEIFASMLSHDLRGPLRVIRTYLDLLGEELVGLEAGEAPDFCARIDDAVLHAQRLIDGIVALARIDRDAEEAGEVDLSALAAQIVADLRSDEPEREAAVHIEPGLRGHGHPDLLCVLLTNLIGNAWKYTAERETAEISFGTWDGLADTFAVRDNGVGFPPDQVKRLFEPFVRAHDGTGFTGDGMGLAIVAKIVRRHGGSIRAESDGASGSAFIFSLPNPQ